MDDHSHLAALARYLDYHQFEVDLHEDHIVVTGREAALTLTIRCRPRESDEGRQWFFAEAGTPIAEAEQVVNAVMVVKGHLRPPT